MLRVLNEVKNVSKQTSSSLYLSNVMYVYIVECSDGSFYTGVTNDMERRLKEHEQGLKKDSYTYSRRPVRMVFCERVQKPATAIEIEKQIKGWRRAKKIALIEGNYDLLRELAKRKKS